MAQETVEQYKQRIARAGGIGRAKSLSARKRKRIAKNAAQARWAKEKAEK
jgi:hypothetical protein